MNAAARRINLLAESLKAKSYLEIGVATGATFDDVQIAHRVAVDPEFGFNPITRQNPSTELYTQTSDEFFLSQPLERLFDIVFIDGLHVFEQVVRDFHNAIIHSHGRSVIILDDTLPSDIFSAIPNGHEAIKFRRAAGLPGGNWHGDVYKLVFYIHDFWQGLNFRTIVDAGNPQTLVWRSNSSRKSLYGDFEKISRMTYIDFFNNADSINESSEEDGIALCVKQLSGEA
jgi:hypothetical protein